MSYINYFLAFHVGLGFYDSIKRYKVKKYYNFFRSTLTWSRDQIENHQVSKIKKLLDYSYNNVAFYKKRFDDANFNTGTFRYLDQLKNIPSLTRKDIQENLKDIISKEYDPAKCYKGSSSGSTGQPVIYYHDDEGSSAGIAALYFGWHLTGWNFGDKQLTLWGNPTTVNIDWEKSIAKIKSRFFNEIKFPAYQLNDEKNFEKLYRQIVNNNCTFLYGYTNAIYLFAKYLNDKKIQLNKIERVITTGENLHDYQKEMITRNIAPVFDDYGCSEINGIAVRTKYDEYYSVLEPHVYVEFGDEIDSASGTHKLIITDFENRVFPFIRYENGDMAIPTKNVDLKDSELKFRKIKSVEGRVSDIITLPNGGNLVVPSFFGSRLLKQLNGINQYQIVKVASDKIIVNLKVDSTFSEEDRKKIKENMNEYIPKELHYDIVFNDSIKTSSNGKFKLFIDNTK
jgi:phenylacetate-CoA ligase